MQLTIRFLRKNWLTILLAFVPPALLWLWLQRETTQLTVTLLTNIPVVSVEQDYANDLQIIYQGQSIASLRVVEIKIENTGTQALGREAFDQPISLQFAASRISTPQVIEVDPPTLTPVIDRVDDVTLSIRPLLFNSEDSFTLRIIILDPVPNIPLLQVGGRIKGVKEIEYLQETQVDFFWPIFPGLIFGIIMSVVSLRSLYRLSFEVKSIMISASGISVKLSRMLERNVGTRERARALATELDIAHHDKKANVLFLRLKIESLLRDLARRARLSDRDQIGSLRHIANALSERGVLPYELVTALHDISPWMNRELHELDSYTSSNEFELFQELALNIIAGLSEHLDSAFKQ